MGWRCGDSRSTLWEEWLAQDTWLWDDSPDDDPLASRRFRRFREHLSGVPQRLVAWWGFACVRHAVLRRMSSPRRSLRVAPTLTGDMSDYMATCFELLTEEVKLSFHEEAARPKFKHGPAGAPAWSAQHTEKQRTTAMRRYLDASVSGDAEQRARWAAEIFDKHLNAPAVLAYAAMLGHGIPKTKTAALAILRSSRAPPVGVESIQAWVDRAPSTLSSRVPIEEGSEEDPDEVSPGPGPGRVPSARQLAPVLDAGADMLAQTPLLLTQEVLDRAVEAQIRLRIEAGTLTLQSCPVQEAAHDRMTPAHEEAIRERERLSARVLAAEREASEAAGELAAARAAMEAERGRPHQQPVLPTEQVGPPVVPAAIHAEAMAAAALRFFQQAFPSGPLVSSPTPPATGGAAPVLPKHARILAAMRATISGFTFGDPHLLSTRHLEQARHGRRAVDQSIRLGNGLVLQAAETRSDDMSSNYDFASFSEGMTQWLLMCSELLPAEVKLDRERWWGRLCMLEALEPHEKVYFAKCFMYDNAAESGWLARFFSDASLMWSAKAFAYPASAQQGRVRQRGRGGGGAGGGIPSPAGGGGRGGGGGGAGDPRAPKAQRGAKGGKGAAAGGRAKGVCFSRSDPLAGECTYVNPPCRFSHLCVNCSYDHAASACPVQWDPAKTVSKP